MHVTIQHCERGAAATDDLARAGHALATRLSAIPGFIACLLLETPDGGCAAIRISEDPASLAASDAIVAGWPPRRNLAADHRRGHRTKGTLSRSPKKGMPDTQTMLSPYSGGSHAPAPSPRVSPSPSQSPTRTIGHTRGIAGPLHAAHVRAQAPPVGTGR